MELMIAINRYIKIKYLYRFNLTSEFTKFLFSRIDRKKVIINSPRIPSCIMDGGCEGIPKYLKKKGYKKSIPMIRYSINKGMVILKF